jgi:hypothetical protein
MKSPIRAAQNKQRGRMRPPGRQFDMPDLDQRLQNQEFYNKQFLDEFVFHH